MGEYERCGAASLTGPVGTATSRLIVVRGNSGSGKTSLAEAVQAARPERSVGARSHGRPAYGMSTQVTSSGASRRSSIRIA